MTIRLIGLLLAGSMLLVAEGLPVADPPIPISVGKVQRLEAEAGPIAIPIHCSPDGDLLLRTWKGWNEGLLYVETAAGKSHVLQFNDERLSKAGLLDFSALGSGRVNAIFTAQEKPDAPFRVLLASWDADGSLTRARHFEPGMHPWQFVTFPSTGNVLLAGTMNDGKPMGRPVLLLIDSNGNLIREVDLKDGYKPPKLPESLNGQVTEAQREAIKTFEELMVFSVLDLDESGNAIFRRGEGNAPIYVISPAGVVVRKLNPPKPPKDGRLVEFRPARGRILWRFVLPERKQGLDEGSYVASSVIFVETDAESGQTVRTYIASDPKLLGPFGCYTPGRVSFITSSKGKMELITADLR